MKRVRRTLCNGYIISFKIRPKREKYVTIHHGNIQGVAIELLNC